MRFDENPMCSHSRQTYHLNSNKCHAKSKQINLQFSFSENEGIDRRTKGLPLLTKRVN